MFLMCAEDFKTAFSHFHLGVACYNLEEYDEAERVLSLVNYLDPSNAETWAYLALVLLKKDNPTINAAYQTMNESIKLGLSDCDVLYEITLTWLDTVNSMKQVLESLDCLIKCKAAGATNSEKARQIRALGAKLKDKTEADEDVITEVLHQFKQFM